MSILRDLLTNYSIIDVILILFMVAFFTKEALNLKDFFHGRAKAKYDEDQKESECTKKLMDKLEDLEDQVGFFYDETTSSLDKINKALKKHEETLDSLIQSDKDDIRLDIVKQHHYFTNKGYIDDFSMDAIEKRYVHYKAAGGNSYITGLMNDLRLLPKK